MRDDKLIEAMAILERMQSYDTEGKDPLAASALKQWAGEVRDALAALREQDGWVKCGCGDLYPANSYGAGFMAAAGQCENCQAGEDAGAEDGWIPCSAQMPPEDSEFLSTSARVLVVDADGNVGLGNTQDGEWITDAHLDELGITHWRSLPPAPQPEEAL